MENELRKTLFPSHVHPTRRHPAASKSLRREKGGPSLVIPKPRERERKESEERKEKGSGCSALWHASEQGTKAPTKEKERVVIFSKYVSS
jgi:hypothetical protein